MTDLTVCLELGCVEITEVVRAIFPDDFIADCLARHQSGDWGEVAWRDAALNDRAVTDGWSVVSVYLRDGDQLNIKTRGDRSLTRVSLLHQMEVGE